MKTLSFAVYLAVIVLFALFPRKSYSQEKIYGIEFSNNITSFPIKTWPQLFYTQFHPGLDFSLSRSINKSEKNRLFLVYNAGGYYHRFIQTAFRIYPALEYNRLCGKQFSFSAGLGAGYSLAFENMETFKRLEDGTYKKKTMAARSQYLVNLHFGIKYYPCKEKTDIAISLKFATFIQGPFVSGYVPMLPVNSVMFGVYKTIPIIKGTKNK